MSTGSEPVPLSVPELRGNEWKYVKECLDSGWVSSAGSFVDRFERELAGRVGAGHAVATVNGTAALHVALRAVGVRPDDEVLVADLTFVAPVNAVRYCGAHPVFMDADPRTWQMDIDKVRRFLEGECVMRAGACVNRRTGRPVRAVLPVHLLGLVGPIDELAALARRHGLKLVEDASEALGVRYRGRHVGTFGDTGIFSFNGNKIVTTGGGGLLVTDDATTARYARYLTTQAKDDAVEGIHHEVGYNYRLTNIQAALGVAQLEQLGAFVARKRAIATTYADELREVTDITLMPALPAAEPNYWLYTILLGEATTLAERQAVVRALNGRGIGVRPLFTPSTIFPRTAIVRRSRSSTRCDSTSAA
jgi:perosamine synthetase